MNRGKAQVLFKYTPGAVFQDQGPWCIVTHFELSNEKRSYTGLLMALENYINQWHKPDHGTLFPNPTERPDKFDIGTVTKVHYELFPLVMRCSRCGEMHWYNTPRNLREHNPEGRCRNKSCGGNLTQYPYAYVHENGDIQPLIAPKSPNDDYSKLFMKDTGRFLSSYWYYGPTKTTIGKNGLGVRTTRGESPQSIGSHKIMRGVRLDQGEVYFCHNISVVDIDLEAIKLREEHEHFGALQLGAFLKVPSFESAKYGDMFSISDSKTDDKRAAEDQLSKALSKVQDLPPELLLALQNYKQVHSVENNAAKRVVEEVNQITGGWFSNDLVKQDKALIEMNYCQYEVPRAKSLDHLISEAGSTNQFVVQNQLVEARNIAHELGLKDLIVHEEFPVILAAIGYTRAKKNPGEAILRPFPANPAASLKHKIPIPIAKNKNEAVMFSLEAKRILAWLYVNDIFSKPDSKVSEIEASAYLYRYLQLYSEDAYSLADQDISDATNVAGLLVFQLLHTMTHMLIQAGKKHIGLDTDSLSEYIFPSTCSAAIYVAKHHEFSLGALVATFRHDLSRWLKATREVTSSCLYDPVCSSGSGACHACTYLKFACKHFNRGLSRILLTGGHFKPVDRNIYGYLSAEVNRVKESI